MKSMTILQDDLENFCFRMNIIAERHEPPLDGNMPYLQEVTTALSHLLGMNIGVIKHPPIVKRRSIKRDELVLISSSLEEKNPVVIFSSHFIQRLLSMLESQRAISSNDTSILEDVIGQLKKYTENAILTGDIKDE